MTRCGKLERCWVRNTYWTDDSMVEQGNPFHRVPMIKVDDLVAWLEIHVDATEENGLHVCLDTMLDLLKGGKP
jgi:hypothetical protein